MKRLKLLLPIVLLASIAFYIVWPAISIWQIHNAIRQGEPATLEKKIDFVRVREAMRPAVRTRISAKIDEIKTSNGAVGAFAQFLGDGIVDRLTSLVLERVVTPVNMIRLANEPGTLPEKINRIIVDEIAQLSGGQLLDNRRNGLGDSIADIGNAIGQLDRQFGERGNILDSIDRGAGQNTAVEGGLAPPAETVVQDGSRNEQNFGLSNIKTFRFAELLAFDIGFARNPKAAAPDLTARMAFTGMDWKVTQIVPNPDRL